MTPDDVSQVRHNEAASRFELDTPSGVGVADYEREGDRITFTHTEVPTAARGQGAGDQLARAGMEYARAEGLKVVPQCPFIASWLREHPEYEDLRA